MSAWVHNLYIGGFVWLIFWFSVCLSLFCVATVVGVSGLSIHDCPWKHSSSRASIHISATQGRTEKLCGFDSPWKPSPVPRKLKVNFIPVLHSCYKKFIYRPFTYLIFIWNVLRHVNQTFLFISGILDLVHRLLANNSHVWLHKWKKKDISCCSLLHIVFVNVFESSCTWFIDFPFLNFIIL